MAAISELSSYPVSSPSIFTSLEWIDHLKIEQFQAECTTEKKNVISWQLCGTSFSVTIDNEAGKWKNRVLFIKQTLADIISNCPKKEKLIFISLGSDRLFMEYIIGKALIEEGYDLSFFLVDPAYSFCPSEKKEFTQKRLKEFRVKMEAIYAKKHNAPFPEENIHYLSRAPNIAKYFRESANVVLIESLPPHGQIIREIEIRQASSKDPQDLLAGDAIVPVEHANAISFIPNAHFALSEKQGAKFERSLPLPIFQSIATKKYYYFDWGCKISKDGSYCVDFSAEKEFIESLRISGKTTKFNDQVILVDTLLTKIKSLLEDHLSKEIKQIQTEHTVKELSQEQISSLLKKVEQVFLKNMIGGAHSFFLRDYALDRAEAVSYISMHGGHYRKAFMLNPDSCAAGYKITIQDIK